MSTILLWRAVYINFKTRHATYKTLSFTISVSMQGSFLTTRSDTLVDFSVPRVECDNSVFCRQRYWLSENSMCTIFSVSICIILSLNSVETISQFLAPSNLGTLSIARMKFLLVAFSAFSIIHNYICWYTTSGTHTVQ